MAVNKVLPALQVVMLPLGRWIHFYIGVKKASGNGTLLKKTSRSLWRREGCRMNLMELLALLTFGLSLLSLIVDVIRLTLEVMDKTSQKKNDESKRD